MGGQVAGAKLDVNTLIQQLKPARAALDVGRVRTDIKDTFGKFDGANAAQMKAILGFDSVKNNVAAFVKDVVIGDSGVAFDSTTVGGFGTLAHALGKSTNIGEATAAYVALRDLASGYDSSKPGSAPANPAMFNEMESAFRKGLQGQEYTPPAANAIGAK